MYSSTLILLLVFVSDAGFDLLQGSMPPTHGTYDLLMNIPTPSINLSASLDHPKNPPPYLKADCKKATKEDPELVYFSREGMLMKDVPCSVAFETQDRLLGGAACDLAAPINRSGQTLFDLCPQTFCELCNRNALNVSGEASKSMEAPAKSAMPEPESKRAEVFVEDEPVEGVSELPAPDANEVVVKTSLVPPVHEFEDEPSLEAPMLSKVEKIHSEAKEL